MKHFENIDELHAYIERQARRTIKHYYTDWKNYDRPDMMKATGNKEKEVYIIVRECGSYFYTLEHLRKSLYARTVMDYYNTDSTAKYFRVDFQKLTVEAIEKKLPDHIRKEAEEKERRERLTA